jgi:acetoin utilization protein AcuB
MRDESPVGIITETDLFRVLLNLLCGRRPGVRLTVALSGAKGTLAKVAQAIFNAGGDIVGLGLNEDVAATGGPWEIMFKVQDAPKDRLVEAVRPVVMEILDVRET